MAGNIRPIFPKAPYIASVLMGNEVFSGRTTTGTASLAAFVGTQADDLLVDSILLKSIHTGTPLTAGLIRLWLYSGSSNAILFREVSVPIKVSDTTANLAWATTLEFNDFVLPSGWSLWMSKTWAYPVVGVLNGGLY